MSISPPTRRVVPATSADARFWASPSLSARQRRMRRDASHMALWTLQGWLAMFYIAAGYAKLTEPLPELTLLMAWPEAVPLTLVRIVGGLEIGLAVLGLAPLLSWRFGRPVLLAATAGLVGIATVFLGYHAVNGHSVAAAVNFCLVVLAMSVLYGRRTDPGLPDRW